MKGGTLEQYIQAGFAKDEDFSEKAISVIMQQIVQAVHFIQQNNIVHRDIKPGTLHRLREHLA